MKLSENLKNIRKEHNLSQEQLAEKLGVSRQAVSKWESGQSYPEMEKVLLICKMFDLNIDELMNENAKEVNEIKQSKFNINKYVEDFFNFISKTVNMFTSMTFMQKIRCLLEQVVVGTFLVLIFCLIACVGDAAISGVLSILPNKIYYFIHSILESVYIILALFIGVVVFLHIFKIRYLDYCEFVKEDDIADNISNDETEASKEIKEGKKYKVDKGKKRFFLERKKERIIIRDPEHSPSKFLSGIAKLIIWGIKAFVALFALGFIFTFIVLIALLVGSFLFAKSGAIFWGTFLIIVSAIIINFLILELSYNIIVSKKNKKMRMAIVALVAFIIAGIGFGLFSIEITKFNLIEDNEAFNTVNDVYEYDMNEDFSIMAYNIDYIEEEIDNVKVEVNHSKYSKTHISYFNDNSIGVYVSEDESTIMELLREIIDNINKKEFVIYGAPNIKVYASKENIEKIKKNAKIEENKQIEFENLQDENYRLVMENLELSEQIRNKELDIENLKAEIENLKLEIEGQTSEINNLNEQIDMLNQ